MVQRQKEGFHVRDLENAGPEHQPPPALQLGKFHTSPFLFIVVSFFFFRPAPGHLGRGKFRGGSCVPWFARDLDYGTAYYHC